MQRRVKELSMKLFLLEPERDTTQWFVRVPQFLSRWLTDAKIYYSSAELKAALIKSQLVNKKE